MTVQDKLDEAVTCVHDKLEAAAEEFVHVSTLEELELD